MDIQSFIDGKRADGLNSDEILKQLAEQTELSSKTIKYDDRQISLDTGFIGMRFDSNEKLEDSDRNKLIDFLVANCSQDRAFFEKKGEDYCKARHDAVLQSQQTAKKLAFVPAATNEPNRSDSAQTDKNIAGRDNYINFITKNRGTVAPEEINRTDSLEDLKAAHSNARSAYIQKISKGRSGRGLITGNFSVKK